MKNFGPVWFVRPIHSGLTADRILGAYDLVYHELKTMVLKVNPVIFSAQSKGTIEGSNRQ